MTDFLVAALQITSTSNVEANFTEAEEQIELAARRGAELIGLPENFAFLGGDDEKLRLASELSEKCANFLKTMSQRYQVFLLGGGYPVPAGDDRHTFNRSALFGKDGQILAKYDKIHLFADSFNKSKSAKTSIESAPFFKAQEIVVVALKTSMTTAMSRLFSGTSFAK